MWLKHLGRSPFIVSNTLEVVLRVIPRYPNAYRHDDSHVFVPPPCHDASRSALTGCGVHDEVGRLHVATDNWCCRPPLFKESLNQLDVDVLLHTLHLRGKPFLCFRYTHLALHCHWADVFFFFFYQTTSLYDFTSLSRCAQTNDPTGTAEELSGAEENPRRWADKNRVSLIAEWQHVMAAVRLGWQRKAKKNCNDRPNRKGEHRNQRVFSTLDSIRRAPLGIYRHPVAKTQMPEFHRDTFFHSVGSVPTFCGM